jgi:hypothetical protein
MVCRKLPYLIDDRRAVGRRSGFRLAAHSVGVLSKWDASGEPAFMRLQAWELALTSWCSAKPPHSHFIAPEA